MTKYLAILGYPLGHTLSPVFQQAALDHYGLDIRYQAWPVEPAALAGAVARLRGVEYLGANVTVPHKEAVMPLLDELEAIAARIGAVNTIVKRGGKLEGHNTDARGFQEALRREMGFRPAGKHAVVLGAGGAAGAVGFALIEAGIQRLAIANRTPERAERLAGDLAQQAKGNQQVLVIAWPELDAELAGCHLLVNCTSMGMKHGPAENESPVKAEQIDKDCLVYDLVYNPAQTPLLKEAEKAGARTLGGLAMLVFQGAASFELWTGKPAPIDVMFEAAAKALEAS